MGEVLEIGFFLFLVAGIAFAPLGYFIYIYVSRKDEPFGNIERHGDSESPILNTVEKVLGILKKAIKK